MKASDIFLTIFIIIVFVMLLLVNILSVGIKNIEDNWPTYRCNPMVMPFAGIFGQDAAQNFTYCIQSMQSNYMNFLLQPLTYNLDIVGNIGTELSDSINSMRAFINNLRGFITDMIQNVFGVFLNILVEFQRILMDVKDMVGKLTGILMALLYTITGSITTMESVWNGPPGLLVKSLSGSCFHPDTIITLVDGSKWSMKDLPLDCELLGFYNNGSVVAPTVVQSVMKISNKKNDGSFREEMYELYCEGDDSVLVTGCHLVFDHNINDFVSVKDMVHNYPTVGRKSTISTPVLYCLITSNHTIPIGRWIFHDWEDNNASQSKTIES